MMNQKNRIENRKAALMGSINNSPGLSLFQLAIKAGLPYVTAHRYMMRLEDDGSIEIHRSGAGCKLDIKPTGRAVQNG